MTIIAYHGIEANKIAALAHMRAHRIADQLIKGQYWEDGKGCAIGCRYHSSDHREAERVDGIPVGIAQLWNALFEGLPNGEERAWPERFLGAIPTGADLSKVQSKFLEWVMLDPTWGVIRHAGDNTALRSTIERVGALHRNGGTPEEGAAWAAEAAWDAGDAQYRAMADKLCELVAASPVIKAGKP